MNAKNFSWRGCLWMLVDSCGLWLTRGRGRFWILCGANDGIDDGGTIQVGIIEHLDLAFLAGGFEVLLIGALISVGKTTVLLDQGSKFLTLPTSSGVLAPAVPTSGEVRIGFGQS